MVRGTGVGSGRCVEGRVRQYAGGLLLAWGIWTVGWMNIIGCNDSPLAVLFTGCEVREVCKVGVVGVSGVSHPQRLGPGPLRLLVSSQWHRLVSLDPPRKFSIRLQVRPFQRAVT